MTTYRDMGDASEDERIDAIGRAAMQVNGRMVAFCTDSEEGKADRYVRKLLEKFPQLEEVDRFNGPVNGVVSVRIRKRPDVN